MYSEELLGFGMPISDTRDPFYDDSFSLRNWTFESMKVTLGSSPDSPFSAPFDGDCFSAMSSNQEQHSSTENLSGMSSSYNSDGFQRCSPPSSKETLQGHSGGNPFSRDVDVGCSFSMRHKLQELETVLMGPDTDDGHGSGFHGENKVPDKSKRTRESLDGEFPYGSPKIAAEASTMKKHRRTYQAAELSAVQNPHLHETPQGDVRQLLIQCAEALQNPYCDFDKLIAEARSAVSINGEPIQRLGAYMVEGLVARKEASGSNIYRTLRGKEPESEDLLSYMHTMNEVCPYLKFGYMAANGAIAEAFKNEDRVHIIDFQIAQGTQWVTLLQALAGRPSGPPHVRITGIDDPVSKYARGEGLEAVGRRLTAISEKYQIPLVFHAVSEFGPEINAEMLHIQPGEALAVNFALQLHHTPDESVDVNNPRDGLLRLVRALSPKVMTLVEQESNTNTAPFFTRFMETLDYYSAMFESIDVTLQRDSKDRINVEQHCLARDIVNIIACEGKERVERHELLGKWRSRLTMAGFKPFPLSSFVNSVIRSLLKTYSEHYNLLEKDEAVLLGWKNRKCQLTALYNY
ncbi:Chitin-inducible gibberellin-responsive protein 1 [Nymphaea thermarum]|nr:Chitin-inducible gibberellin-responsive protein 1 [Nymphaea thermarum]